MFLCSVHYIIEGDIYIKDQEEKGEKPSKLKLYWGCKKQNFYEDQY